jgi:hypothetical protein
MTDNFAELLELCDAVFDGRALPAEVARLEELVLSSPAHRRRYVELAQQHSALSWAAIHPNFVAPAIIADQTHDIVASTSTDTRRRRGFLAAALTTVAALAVVAGFALRPQRESNGEFATLERVQNATWSNSTLPIQEGARLSSGRMELADGMATIDFDKGVKLVLEAPAVFELIDENQCRLHKGKVRAEVRPGGEGFVVLTPTARLIDRGTVFGVHVQVGGVSDLWVFKGRVDAQHNGTGQQVSAQTGTGLRMTNAQLEKMADPNATPKLPATATEEQGLNSIQISTAIGRGMDAYIQQIVPPPEKRSDTLLLLKNNNRKFGGERFYDWHRKVYLRFDLSLLGGKPANAAVAAPIVGNSPDQAFTDLKKVGADLAAAFEKPHRTFAGPSRHASIQSAKLELHADRSSQGFASHCPDATFAVYGMTDEALDDWGDEKLKWDDAPANFPDGRSFDVNKSRLLGRFTIPQGQCTGIFGISSPELVEFLDADTNGLATLMIVRETIGNGVSDIVHSFASRRHPSLPAPMLRLVTGGTPQLAAAGDAR